MDSRDRKSLTDEFEKIGRQKPPSYFMLCFNYCFRCGPSLVRRKRSRRKALMEASVDLFENSLDVRNSVSNSINLAILLDLLLDEK